MDTLNALSPLDGRYAAKLDSLREIFSELGLLKRRVEVEIAWLTALCNEPAIPEARALTSEERIFLSDLSRNFNLEDAIRVKEIEKITNHDVKAIEYFIKERLRGTTLEALSEFIHFACTSDDINNVAYALMLRDGVKILRAAQQAIIDRLRELAKTYRDSAMLARTHGQPASPTTLGKELAVFANRLKRQLTQLDAIKLPAKMNGAVGCYNAHAAAYPEVNWPALSGNVIEKHFGLELNPLTTQIEPHDGMAEIFDALARWNTVLTDLDRDCWQYISMGYLSQKVNAGETGSSTMPHKVNPIDFENSEGNLGMANALLEYMARKLPISRLQRDLSDSTVLRNIGVAIGYCLLAYQATLKGLGKIAVNIKRLDADLENAWEVLAEPIQTIMRKYGIENPYEKLKEITRGRKIDAKVMRNFIATIALPENVKQQLLEMTPKTYIGLAENLAENN